MSSFSDNIENRLIPAIALERVDEHWRKTLDRSVIFRPWIFLRSKFEAATQNMSKVGTVLQQLAFVAIALLFAIIPAPQFAADKEFLALIVMGALGLRMLGRLMNGAEKYQPTAIDAIVLLYFGMHLVATFASHYFAESLRGFAKMLVFAASYFLFTDVLQHSSKNRALIILASLLGGALIVSLYGLYQYKIGVAPLATWEDPTIQDSSTRIYSTFGNPNFFAGYLIPIVPVSVAVALCAFFQRGWLKVLGLPLLGVSAVIGAAAVLTQSRGGYIGLIAGLGALFLIFFQWVWRAQPKARIAMLLVLVALPILAALTVHTVNPNLEKRFLTMFSKEHSSNAYRMNVWKSSLQMFEDNWWFGIGAGNQAFRLAYGLYMRSGFDALGTYCVPLEVAVESGILGLLAFLWLLAAILARAHSRFYQLSDPTQKCIIAGAAAGIIGMMAHGLVDTVFYRPQVQLVFWLLIAIVVAVRFPPRDTQ